ncbi:MAG: FtsQ-type POTRA domain-containing protein [Candidatus Gracilibacteria bacterium]
MPLFGFLKKKKKSGTSSRIAQFQSPYLRKQLLPDRVLKRSKKRHSILIPPARLKAPKSGKSKKWLLILLTIFILGGGTYLITTTHFFDLQNWQVSSDGTLVDDSDPIYQILAAEKGKNILFLDENKIISDIKNIHPDIAKIQISKIFPKKIKVEFEKYPIAANIINVVGKIQKKLLVDSIGLIVDQNNENPDLPYIRITSSEALNLNDTAIPEDKLAYILQAIKFFQSKFGMKVIDCDYMLIEREIRIRTEKFFYVWIDITKDLNLQLEKLKKVQGKLDIYNTPLEYIDLRISGTDNEKVIFKPRSK